MPPVQMPHTVSQPVLGPNCRDLFIGREFAPIRGRLGPLNRGAFLRREDKNTIHFVARQNEHRASDLILRGWLKAANRGYGVVEKLGHAAIYSR